MVDLGGRAGHRRQPHDEPAAADPDARGARRSSSPTAAPTRRGRARFKYYLIARRVRHRAADRVPLGVRLGHHRERPHPRSRLPHIPTPNWYAGIQIGGPVSLEATLSAAVDGLRLGTMLCCIGAANALANPKRALRVLPGRCTSSAWRSSVVDQPRPAADRERPARRAGATAARRHAGAAGGRCAASRSRFWPTRSTARCCSPRPWTPAATAAPGRSTAASRRATAGLMLAGLVGLCVGAYGLLGRRPRPRWLGMPAIARRAAAVLRRAGARRPAGHPHPVPPRPVARAGMGRRRLRRAQRGAAVSEHRLQRGRPEPELLSAALSAAARRSRPLAILIAAIAGVRRPTAARASVAGRRPPRRDARPRRRARDRRCRRDRVRPGHDHLRRRRPSRCCATSRSQVDEGELCLVVGRTGIGKSTLLGADQRPRPALHRRHAGRPGARSTAATPRPTRRASSPTSSASSARTRSPGSSPTPSRRSSPTGWSSSPSPPEVMRKRVEETLDLLGLAELRRPPAARALRRPAAAGGDRRRAHRPPARAGARRADLGARPDRGRGGARDDHPAGPRPRADRACSPSTGSSASSSTPTGSSTCRATASVDRRARRAEMLRRQRRRAAGGRARPAGGLVAAAAVGPRRAPARRRRCASGWPPRPPAAGAPGRRAGTAALRARDVVVRYGDVVAVARCRPRARAPGRSPR